MPIGVDEAGLKEELCGKWRQEARSMPIGLHRRHGPVQGLTGAWLETVGQEEEGSSLLQTKTEILSAAL